MFICLFIDLFVFYFNNLGTPTGKYPENFVKIRLDLAEIYRILKKCLFVCLLACLIFLTCLLAGSFALLSHGSCLICLVCLICEVCARLTCSLFSKNPSQKKKINWKLSEKKRKKSKFEANNIFKKKPSQKEKNWEIKQKNYF